MPTSRRLVDNEGEDFYPTPSWCIEALLACEDFQGQIWEPACPTIQLVQSKKETNNGHKNYL